ncbi:unnamed protein product [Adineta ricciae]|uniref:Uncharacterized protein n=1 Tax=Adineta ricciae TaxID=249248 RepID=A0A815P0B5_ADIRI|nr:unnamed protein product [Adineta ricciae]
MLICFIILADTYTFIFNVSSISGLVICSIGGFIIGFRADRSKKQKLLNISFVQTLTWILNVVLCVACMFLTTSAIVTALVINNIGRALVEAGCQTVLVTFFPPKYVGTLTGNMETLAHRVDISSLDDLPFNSALALLHQRIQNTNTRKRKYGNKDFHMFITFFLMKCYQNNSHIRLHNNCKKKIQVHTNGFKMVLQTSMNNM